MAPCPGVGDSTATSHTAGTGTNPPGTAPPGLRGPEEQPEEQRFKLTPPPPAASPTRTPIPTTSVPARNKPPCVLRHPPCAPRQAGPSPKAPPPLAAAPCPAANTQLPLTPSLHRPGRAPCARSPGGDVQAHAPRVPRLRALVQGSHTHTRVLSCPPVPCGTRRPCQAGRARASSPAGCTSRLPGERTLPSLTPTNHTGSPRCSPAQARPCRKRRWLPAAFSLH